LSSAVIVQRSISFLAGMAEKILNNVKVKKFCVSSVRHPYSEEAVLNAKSLCQKPGYSVYK
jgi:hypothetical protein